MKSTIHEFQKNNLQGMSKNLKTIFALAFIAILSSCSKDGDTTTPTPSPNPADAVYRVKEYRDASNVAVISYLYNAQNKMTKVVYAGGSFVNYTYNTAGLLITEEYGGNINSANNGVTSYVYDTTGAKIESVSTRNNGLSKGKFVYTNNSSGLPTGYKYFNWNAATSTWVASPSNDGLYFYNTNNQEIRFQRATDYTIYTYDDRGNQNSARRYTIDAINGNYLSYQANSTYDDKKYNVIDPNYKQINNALTANAKSLNQAGVASQEVSGNNTYEYNEAGYPTKQFTNGVLSVIYVLEKVQ